MTPAEVESMCQRAREDDAYRAATHAGYLERVTATLDLLREKGVTRAKLPLAAPGGDWVLSEFDLAPPTAPDAPAVVPADLGAGEKKCPCGHLQDSEHNNDGLCIAGACPYTVCHPGATAKPG